MTFPPCTCRRRPSRCRLECKLKPMHPQTLSFQHHPPHTFTPTHLLPPPEKSPKTSYRKSTLPKSAKTSDVGMHFHQKTLPQKPMKQVTMPTAMRAQTTHTSQRNALNCVATIPTSFQPHPPQSVPRPHTQLHAQYFLQHTQSSTIITINHDTSS